MTPEDVGYCRTSLTSGVLYLLLFSVLAVIILYQCFVGYFRCELLFIGIVTFVNLGKTNLDFPNIFLFTFFFTCLLIASSYL